MKTKAPQKQKSFSEMTTEEKSKAIKDFLMGMGDLRNLEYQPGEDPVEYGKRINETENQ